MVLTSRFLVFLGAALILAITPGPGIFYVLARSLRGGRREGVLSAAGTFLGGLVHVGAAAFGLSAILAASAIAFETVRYAGAVYLIYLGYRMIRSRNEEAAEREAMGTFTQYVRARRDDGSAQPEDGSVFSFIHPAIRCIRAGARCRAILDAGRHFGGAQHLRGSDGRVFCGTVGIENETQREAAQPPAWGIGRGNYRAGRLCGYGAGQNIALSNKPAIPRRRRL